MEESTEIMELEQLETGLTYFNKVEAGLSILEAKYATVPDASTKEGKEEIRKGLAEMRPLRTTVDKRRLKLGKKLRQDLKDINSIGNRIISRIKVVEDPFKEAKVAAEKIETEAEANRVAGIKTRLQSLSDIFTSTEGQTAAEILQALTTLVEEALPTDFDEFQTEAETIKAEVLVRLRKRLDITKEAEAKVEVQKLEAIRLKEEGEKLEKAKVTRNAEIETAKTAAKDAKIKADKAEKEAEARIATREKDAKDRIKKMEDDARARIGVLEPEQAPVAEDEDLDAKLGKLPPLMTQKEIEESLRQSAQKASPAPSFGGQDDPEPEVKVPVKAASESQNKAAMLALRGKTGMGMRMAGNVLEAVKNNEIPHLTWVQ